MVEVPGIEPGSEKALQLAPHASSFIESLSWGWEKTPYRQDAVRLIG